RYVWSEHLAVERYVHLQHLSAERHSREARVHRTRVIRKTHRTVVPLSEEPEQVETDLIRWARVCRGALQHGERDPVRTDTGHGGVDFVEATHAGRQHDRKASLRHPIE